MRFDHVITDSVGAGGKHGWRNFGGQGLKPTPSSVLVEEVRGLFHF